MTRNSTGCLSEDEASPANTSYCLCADLRSEDPHAPIKAPADQYGVEVVAYLPLITSSRLRVAKKVPPQCACFSYLCVTAAKGRCN